MRICVFTCVCKYTCIYACLWGSEVNTGSLLSPSKVFLRGSPSACGAHPLGYTGCLVSPKACAAVPSFYVGARGSSTHVCIGSILATKPSLQFPFVVVSFIYRCYGATKGPGICLSEFVFYGPPRPSVEGWVGQNDKLTS